MSHDHRGLRPDLDHDLQAAWLAIWADAPDIADHQDTSKATYLVALYAQTHSELREKEKSQQQLVTWALTILTAAGIFSLAVPSGANPWPGIVLILGIPVITVVLILGIRSLADDRVGLARNLDRMHRVMGAFSVDYYYAGGTLFEPAWYGWGFDESRVANLRLVRRYIFLIWCLGLVDMLTLAAKALVLLGF